MTSFSFTIPVERSELLNDNDKSYFVRELVPSADIISKLEVSGETLRDEGPLRFILDNFDTFYSVLHFSSKISTDVIDLAYKQLNKAMIELRNHIILMLDDKESLSSEMKMEVVTVLKMQLYIFKEFILYYEEKDRNSNAVSLKKGKKKKTSVESFAVNKNGIIETLISILERDIGVFWEPPIVEHDLIGLVGSISFEFLQNPSIKAEKEFVKAIFYLLGLLIKRYQYNNFVGWYIRVIRMNEHVAHSTLDGLKSMIDEHSCESLIPHLLEAATEWQVEETFPDAQGTRNCSTFLVELTASMPKLVLPNVDYLTQYLGHQSAPLRIAVLTIIHEIILKCLTGHNLEEEQKCLRDQLFDDLIEHLRDSVIVVRAKVAQSLGKLQKENAIPLALQDQVLSKIKRHLFDKGVVVRKYAVQCITIFLEYNPYGADLQLKTAQEELQKKKEMLKKIEGQYQEMLMKEIEERYKKWSELEPLIIAELKKLENEDEDEEENEDEENGEDFTTGVNKIQEFFESENLKDGLALYRKLRNNFDEWKRLFRKVKKGEQLDLDLNILKKFYVNEIKIVEELRTKAGMSPEAVTEVKTLENEIKFYQDAINFMNCITEIMKDMKALLFSQNISDSCEAIQFFVAAQKFQIEGASAEICDLLKLMRCNEEERKKSVVEAFKLLYLVTDAKDMTKHAGIVLDRLLQLFKSLTYENCDDFEDIITDWTKKGILDNAIIDKCWKYYTQIDSVTDDDARAAGELLRMAAKGRSTIITKNINVVAKIMFNECHREDLLFVATSCKFVAVAATKDDQSAKEPFVIHYDESIFDDLHQLLVENFAGESKFYSEALIAGVDMIARLSSKPFNNLEKLVKAIDKKYRELPEKKEMHVIRLCELLGNLAVKTLWCLDSRVYQELKERNNLRNKKKEGSKKNKRKSALETSTKTNEADESMLTGAVAEDEDAEFILNELENNIVTGKSILATYEPFIVMLCRNPDKFGDRLVQLSAVTALMRFMLVSSKVASKNMRLLFTVLKETPYEEVKCTMVVHCADLLTRFPNLVDPWTPTIANLLNDAIAKVRKITLFSLASLIIKDMIRAHKHVADMAISLIDQDESVKEMCKVFFERLAQKENNLMNYIPDIFTRLIRITTIDQEDLRFIMKFLFGLIDASKKMENLVERFCIKFTPDDNLRLNRNIIFSLTLIKYNEKSLKKLHEKFPSYKHHLHDAEIYAMINQILNESKKKRVGKANLLPIVQDIEASINEVFEISEDGPKRPQEKPKRPETTKKKTGKKQKKTRKNSSSEEEEISPRKCRSAKKQKQTRKSSSSSEEDFTPRKPARKQSRVTNS